MCKTETGMIFEETETPRLGAHILLSLEELLKYWSVLIKVIIPTGERDILVYLLEANSNTQSLCPQGSG